MADIFALIVRVACDAACILPVYGTTAYIGDAANGAAVEIQSGDYGSYQITYHNAMTYALNVEQWIVEVDGVVASGMILHGAGDQPDDMVVNAPAGFFCDPCQITVAEGASGEVVLYPEVGA